MKLRILGNSIRLRLSQSEVDEIQNGNSVQEHVQFGTNVFVYELKPTSSSELNARFENNTIVVEIPFVLGNEWAAGNEVSLNGQAGPVKLLIEKDFKCLTDRNEDESDLFPNPNTEC